MGDSELFKKQTQEEIQDERVLRQQAGSASELFQKHTQQEIKYVRRDVIT